MKRLLPLILLLVCPLLSGQMIMRSSFSHDTIGFTSEEGSYSSQFQTVLNAMTNPTTGDTLGWCDTLCIMLDTAGFWDRHDYLLVATNNSTNALINWIDPGNPDADNVSSTAFTPWEGFTGDGSADYISTNWIPGTHGDDYTQNSAAFYIWLLKDQTENIHLMGTSDNTNLLLPRTTTHGLFARINMTSSNYIQIDASSIPSDTLYIVSRTGANNIEVYVGSTSVGEDTDASTSLSSSEFTILTRNQVNFSTQQFFIFGIMDGVTDTDTVRLYNILAIFKNRFK
jgi:hypothetical protein